MARAPSRLSSSPERPTRTPAAMSTGPPTAASAAAPTATSSPSAVAATGGSHDSARASTYAVDSQPRTRPLPTGSASPCQRDQAARYSSRLSTPGTSGLRAGGGSGVSRDSRGVFSGLAPARRRLVLALLAVVAVLGLAGGGVLVGRRLTADPVEPVPQATPGPVLLVPGYGGGQGALRALADVLTAEGRDAT